LAINSSIEFKTLLSTLENIMKEENVLLDKKTESIIDKLNADIKNFYGLITTSIDKECDNKNLFLFEKEAKTLLKKNV
jgi:hypothetical protein